MKTKFLLFGLITNMGIIFSNNIKSFTINSPISINGIVYKNYQPPHNIEELNEVLQRETNELQRIQNDRRKDFEKNSKGFQNWLRDLEYQKQKFKNVEIIKNAYDVYLSTKDKKQNPFSENTRYEVDEFNVYEISNAVGNNKIVTILAGSTISPNSNSQISVNTDSQTTKIISNNIISQRRTEFQQKAYDRLNQMITQVSYNQ